jgi:hypothetical protein
MNITSEAYKHYTGLIVMMKMVRRTQGFVSDSAKIDLLLSHPVLDMHHTTTKRVHLQYKILLYRLFWQLNSDPDACAIVDVLQASHDEYTLYMSYSSK